ncbi:hypothetical protein HMN09_00527400 [Mycena chlorophos]|uniref:RRM domain-containing protein n=1 Tax=Mycena chlorophos TaxID=658473 RepID=A0A8H6TDA3_MYCCL|nr:hypothetical protein HMN09_00527400 [Mycena chlorophos]
MASARLYLKNLPRDATREDVAAYLGRFGRLTECKIVVAETTCYGFATYAAADDANFVLTTFRGRLFLGHKTIIERAEPMRRSAGAEERVEQDRRSRALRRFPVLVENLPRNTNWQALKDFARLNASPFVAYCDVRDGRGVIEYQTEKDAELAIRALNGKKLAIRSRSPTRRPTLLHRRPSSAIHSASSHYYEDTPTFSLLSRASASYRTKLDTGSKLEAPSPRTVTTHSILNRDYDYDSYLRDRYEEKLQQIHNCP